MTFYLLVEVDQNGFNVLPITTFGTSQTRYCIVFQKLFIKETGRFSNPPK